MTYLVTSLYEEPIRIYYKFVNNFPCVVLCITIISALYISIPMNLTMNRRKTTNDQFEKMITLEQNRCLITNEGKKDDIKSKWKSLKEILNSDPMGPEKDEEKWKKTFHDWKCYVRKKAAKIKVQYNLTGGGPPTEDKLSDMEERLLAVIGKVSAEVCNAVQESVVIIDGTELMYESSKENYKETTLDFMTPTTEHHDSLFDKQCSQDKFRGKRFSITTDIANKLVSSQQASTEQSCRLADAEEKKNNLLEEEIKLKKKKVAVV